MNHAERNGMALLLNNIDPKITDMSNLDAQLKQAAKERYALDAINDAKRAARNGENKPENELARLRGELWQITERAKHTEIYTNEQAGRVKLLEQNINDALKAKKAAAEAGNARGERNHEHNIQRLERELVDLEKEFQRARKVSAGCAIVLKEWPHRERVAELEKLVA